MVSKRSIVSWAALAALVFSACGGAAHRGRSSELEAWLPLSTKEMVRIDLDKVRKSPHYKTVTDLFRTLNKIGKESGKQSADLDFFLEVLDRSHVAVLGKDPANKSKVAVLYGDFKKDDMTRAAKQFTKDFSCHVIDSKTWLCSEPSRLKLLSQKPKQANGPLFELRKKAAWGSHDVDYVSIGSPAQQSASESGSGSLMNLGESAKSVENTISTISLRDGFAAKTTMQTHDEQSAKVLHQAITENLRSLEGNVMLESTGIEDAVRSVDAKAKGKSVDVTVTMSREVVDKLLSGLSGMLTMFVQLSGAQAQQ